MRWFQRILGIAYLATVCGSTALQAQHRSPRFGSDGVQAIAISARDMGAVGGETTWAQNAIFYRYLTRGVLNLIAAVSAPQGSPLTALDFEACDLPSTPSSRAKRGIPSPAGPEPYYRFRDPSAFGLGMTA